MVQLYTEKPLSMVTWVYAARTTGGTGGLEAKITSIVYPSVVLMELKEVLKGLHLFLKNMWRIT